VKCVAFTYLRIPFDVTWHCVTEAWLGVAIPFHVTTVCFSLQTVLESRHEITDSIKNHSKAILNLATKTFLCHQVAVECSFSFDDKSWLAGKPCVTTYCTIDDSSYLRTIKHFEVMARQKPPRSVLKKEFMILVSCHCCIWNRHCFHLKTAIKSPIPPTFIFVSESLFSQTKAVIFY
jgi:hypothetical protein